MGKRVDLVACPDCEVLAMYQPGKVPAPWRCVNCGWISETPEFEQVDLPLVTE